MSNIIDIDGDAVLFETLIQFFNYWFATDDKFQCFRNNMGHDSIIKNYAIS